VTQLRTQDRPLSLKVGRRVLHRHSLSGGVRRGFRSQRLLTPPT
jgi:hypothetical protein